jgi:hypothetical protein
MVESEKTGRRESDRAHLAARIARIERVVMAWTASVAVILVALGALLPAAVFIDSTESASANLVEIAVSLIRAERSGWSRPVGIIVILAIAVSLSATLALYRLGAARSTSRIEMLARACAVLAALGTASVWLVLWTPSDLFVDATVGVGVPLLTIGVIIALLATFSRTYIELWEG